MNKVRWAAITASVVLFLAGAVVGGLAMRVATDAYLLKASEREPEQRHAEQVLWGLDKTLHLHGDQKERIAARLHTRYPDMVVFLRSVEPEARALQQKYEDDIRAELDDRQRAHFEHLIEQVHARHQRSLQP